jgi:hypothetical protein
MKFCYISSALFSIITIFQFYQLEMFDFYRPINGMLITFSSLLYHSFESKNTYIFDQLIIWSNGLNIFLYDYSLHIIFLVGFAILSHFIFRPLNDQNHCIFIHCPILIAILTQVGKVA